MPGGKERAEQLKKSYMLDSKPGIGTPDPEIGVATGTPDPEIGVATGTGNIAADWMKTNADKTAL